ncbi:MAG: hypothetical protein ABEJ35_07200 [Halobacteriaceae archaeon]
MAQYVVAIKGSARSRNAAAGEWVANRGSRRTFWSKAAAKRWAARVSGDGSEVWIQDAAPWDSDDVDGYLVGGTRTGAHRSEEAGDQTALNGAGDEA